MRYYFSPGTGEDVVLALILSGWSMIPIMAITNHLLDWRLHGPSVWVGLAIGLVGEALRRGREQQKQIA